MNYSHGALFIIGILMIGAGALIAERIIWKLSCLRRKRWRVKLASQPRPKPEPQVVELNVVLTGVDDLEAGLERVEAALLRIAEAAGGVPVTINNYYSDSEQEVEE